MSIKVILGIPGSNKLTTREIFVKTRRELAKDVAAMIRNFANSRGVSPLSVDYSVVK